MPRRRQRSGDALQLDTSDGSAHGGWHIPYMDDTAAKWIAAYLAETVRFLFGRRTYELLASYWPHGKPEEAAIAGR